jgi:hypothetical protein
MEANLVTIDERGIAVRVYDNDGYEHRLCLTEDGEIDLHTQDRFAPQEEQRSPHQEKIVQQVRARAVFAAHQETEVDLLSWEGNIRIIERTINLISGLSDNQFKEQFEDYYRAVVGDPRQGADRDHIPFESVQFVYLPAIVDEDEPRFERVGDPSYDYVDENDEHQMVGSQPDFEPNLLFQHYVVGEDVPFPDGFRDLLTHHLRCQIRDVYLNMGTEPPPEYDIEGMGKIRIHGRPSIDDEYVTG